MDSAIHLTSTEWAVLNCLWENAPQTTMELVAGLKKSSGWSKGTTTTMLRRMSEKGLITCIQGEKARLYSPAVNRESAVLQETKSFLSRVYGGSVGMMISAMARHEELDQEEIDQLYEVLKEAEDRKAQNGSCTKRPESPGKEV